jgi:hypothetical protein
MMFIYLKGAIGRSLVVAGDITVAATVSALLMVLMLVMDALRSALAIMDCNAAAHSNVKVIVNSVRHVISSTLVLLD